MTKPNIPNDIELKHVTKEFPLRRGESVATRAVDEVSLEIPDGEFFALLGPSGCGKTTTLRMIAGFEEPTSGEIILRGQQMQHVPPFHRPVNTVFQDYALFPHMTVLQNIMFGLEMEGVSKKEATQRASEALELVRLPQVGGRKPRQLSGGQQQRVALARALVKRPAVLLLDEPLGALDLKLRKAMQFELKSMQQQLGITFIYVTHDQEEALTMADRIAVMDKGKVLQIGTPEEIYETPTTQFVADFIGETNFLKGQLIKIEGEIGTVQLDEQTTVCATIGIPNLTAPSDVVVGIRPEKISLLPIEGAVRNPAGVSTPASDLTAQLGRDNSTTLIRGVVKQAIYIGTDTRYVVRIGQNADVVVRVQNFGHRNEMTFEEGQAVNVYWSTKNARVLIN
ncbi:MAG: ABC transporter ATP-binding protein [Burkholderiales bacterium]|nr:ABC transporter ATP-binding protein [Anaerolineae bacterium]